MLTRNHRQEGLCRAYILAIAARCGMTWSIPTNDYGIDLTLHDIEQQNGQRMESGFNLDVQAKSTTRSSLDADFILFDLDIRSYNVLRFARPGTPRVLIVLVLPAEESSWLHQSEEELILRHSAFWMFLRGEPPSKNRRSVRLQIPRTQLLSVASLREVMERMKEEPK